ncbi:hypothetical protein DL95DRAFT_177523 [Leptodontidium sp. 2 PMI_412]|nr:hypothetical protein DL95DRAFT_177523 [Leptodontidium sp. 2 PMI_412]
MVLENGVNFNGNSWHSGFMRLYIIGFVSAALSLRKVIIRRDSLPSQGVTWMAVNFLLPFCSADSHHVRWILGGCTGSVSENILQGLYHRHYW